LPDSGLPMLLLDGGGIAAVAGLNFAAMAVTNEAAAEAEEPGVQALLFDDLDGHRRAIALAVIDRVEPIATDTIRFTAGALRLAIGGTTVPLHLVGDLGNRAEVPVLRLTDGERCQRRWRRHAAADRSPAS
jgi:two-component system chemotaxis sensor kinase CheA